MTTPSHVRELFDLPDQVRKGDFVLKLSEGIERPQETAATYVATPAIVESLDRALRLVGSALKDGRSQAAFIHGSFGSGKSHFMALLSHLLAGQEDAWRLPELHVLRERHTFVGKKKLLELQFHMLGKDNIESAIFAGYIEFVRKHHSDATIPGLFADEQLFADAGRMLDELGDAKFFAPMNEGAAPSAGWGKVTNAWTRARFEESARSTDPKEREKLFSALVKTRFKSYAQESRAFDDIDSGLGTLARHAKDLGYDGVVLFLDELILWLAHRASESAWLHNQVQKMDKLVEAQDAARPIPIVSFIARQRSLVDMVGSQHTGLETARLADSLKHSEGRYDKIALEDRNLPAILEKRVLKPKDEGAKKTLDDAFDKMKRGSGGSWQTLLGHEDAAAFRKLYPFSPALVEALVALSNSLQRERTAIKLLMELLVDHVEDLPLGDVVGVGDLFDVLAGADDPADGVMKARFEAAKQTYRTQFLPMLQETHQTNTAQRCQRLRGDHSVLLGCANCPEKACRLDNRLIKTLIVAALVPEVAVLKDMTAGKLAQLNHGSIRLPIPGAEAANVATKLRKWAASIGQLHVGQQSDPTVRLVLEGVDLGPILQQARELDTPGARQKVIRDMLFGAMGVDPAADYGKDTVVGWRGTKRVGHVRFGNVRKLGPDQLRCPEDHDWRLIVDYPFDDEGFGPSADLAVLDEFTSTGTGSWTLVWLPSFFSKSITELLGDLVILEYLLETTETKRRAVAHLSVENQSRALLDLDNLRNQKRARLNGVLAQAYGLATAKEGDLDPSLRIDKHLHLLKPGAHFQAPSAAALADALEQYVPALLETRHPRHPCFDAPLTSQRVARIVERFGEIIDAEHKRIPADKALVAELRGSLGELGLVRVTEGAVHLLEDKTLQDLERRRAQKAVDAPTAGELRRWVDEGQKMGLQIEALDVVVRCYARWSARTLVRGGKPFEVKSGQEIPDDVVLEKPELPTHADWTKAFDAAGAALGFSLPGKALHADNLKRFEAGIRNELPRAKLDAAAKLPGVLRERLVALDQPADADRRRTAKSADLLCAALDQKSGLGQVQALAAFVFEGTSAKAVGASLRTAVDTVIALEDALVFGVFAQLQARREEIEGAPELVARVAQALRQDELNEALVPRLRALAVEGQRLLAPKPNLAGVAVSTGSATSTSQTKTTAAGFSYQSLQGSTRDEAIASLRLALEALGALPATASVKLEGTLTLPGKSE